MCDVSTSICFVVVCLVTMLSTVLINILPRQNKFVILTVNGLRLVHSPPRKSRSTKYWTLEFMILSPYTEWATGNRRFQYTDIHLWVNNKSVEHQSNRPTYQKERGIWRIVVRREWKSGGDGKGEKLKRTSHHSKGSLITTDPTVTLRNSLLV